MTRGPLQNAPSLAPTRKVTGATVGAAAAVVAIWVASLFGVEVPDRVSDALTVIGTFLGGYLPRERV